ncbi:hypothetical protein [Candidatus Seongchinamella marina]|nr:hypothetical protein [Candidatus Seongchinamella marina]
MTPNVLTAAKFSALSAFEEKDYEQLGVTLTMLQQNAEPYRYRQIRTEGYFGVESLQIETRPLQPYCKYLDKCITELESFNPKTFETLIEDVISMLGTTAWMSKQLAWQQDHDRTKEARRARKFDDTKIREWFTELTPNAQKLSCRSLTQWMLDNWESKFGAEKQPSERSLRRSLTRIKRSD